MKSRILTLLFGLFLLLSAGIPVHGQESDEAMSVRALKLANLIQENELIEPVGWAEGRLVDDAISNDDRLYAMRSVFIDAVTSVEQFELKKIAVRNEEMAQEIGSETDKQVAALFSIFANSFEIDAPDEIQVYEQIEPFLDSNNWFVKHQSLYLISSMLGTVVEPAVALERAMEGMNLIPQEESVYVVEAKVRSLESLTYLHNILANKDLAVSTTEELIEFRLSHNLPTDGITLLNNLVVTFSSWRDYETALDLSETLLQIENKIGVSTPGLTEARIAEIHNELENFDQALSFSELAEKEADYEIVSRMAELQKAIALIGLNKMDESATTLASFTKYYNEKPEFRSGLKGSFLKAQAHFALASGAPEKARKLFAEQLSHSVIRELETANQQTTSKLAALQNTQERQAEREASLQREAELKQVALDQEQQSNRLLSALIVALCLGMVGVLCFALYRTKISKRLEISAQQAEAGEKSKSEFLAMMSHELRTPLNGIIGLSDHLSRDADNADVRMKSDIILSSGNDLLGLVENILDMTLIEGGGIEAFPERTEIGPIIEQATAHWRPLIEDKGVIFTVHIDDTVPAFLDTDPKRFAQCVNNLLSNAAKFTSKGRVHMHVTGRELSPGMSELKVIVADTGIGITDDAQSRLFQPFVQADTSMTRHYGGAGLGLAITRSLARMMGGDVTVVSRTGRGSEFTLTVSGAAEAAVPLIEIAPEKTMTEIPLEAEPAPLEGRLSQRRFLVVEDDVNNQDVLKAVLQPMGAKVICAYNGEDALKALKENLFDIILMDIRMPELNGIETTQIIRNSGRAYSDIPIIAITADVASVTYSQAKAAGVDIFLTKPINTGALLDAIEAVERSRDIRAAETA